MQEAGRETEVGSEEAGGSAVPSGKGRGPVVQEERARARARGLWSLRLLGAGNARGAQLVPMATAGAAAASRFSFTPGRWPRFPFCQRGGDSPALREAGAAKGPGLGKVPARAAGGAGPRAEATP